MTLETILSRQNFVHIRKNFWGHLLLNILRKKYSQLSSLSTMFCHRKRQFKTAKSVTEF